MLDLWLVRHAESVGNLDGTHADTDLSPRGQQQARALARAVSGFAYDAVWTSPLARARQTAALALPGAAAIVDERLTELESGAVASFVDTSNPSALRALLASAPTPGESGKDFMARVGAWREALSGEGRVIVFTHFGVVRELLAGYLGFRRAPQEMAFTGIFRLAVGAAAPEVLAWNDDAHVGR